MEIPIRTRCTRMRTTCVVQETKTLGIAEAVCGTGNISNKMPPITARLQMWEGLGSHEPCSRSFVLLFWSSWLLSFGEYLAEILGRINCRVYGEDLVALAFKGDCVFSSCPSNFLCICC
jgi:hypothetical protein